MNPTLRELLTDLKAAALIGHPESLASALDGIRALDDEQLPPSTLLPLGRALTPLPAKTLKPLYVDDDPAIRALVSIALGERYMQGKDVTSTDLEIIAEDPNPEVGTALARALIEFTPSHLEKLNPLIQSWLAPPGKSTSQQTSKSPKPQILPALLLLPFSPHPPGALLAPLVASEDHDLREALVTCLSTLAEKGHPDPVFDLLTEWATQPKPNLWLITRTLSSSWAQAHPEKSIRLLNDLAAQAGMIRPIVRTLDKFGALPPISDP
jgi:hypothetical protein